MFTGFTDETVDFMWGIRFNNERGWFMEHKEEYQQHLLEPTKALAAQVYEGLKEKLPHEPLMVKVSRIYRDARRLHGRGPYKDHLWFCVRTGDENWTGRPTFYFEIAPEYYSYGMGFWAAEAALMERWRQEVQRDSAELEKLVKAFNRSGRFTLEGPEYKRSKGEFDELLRPWMQKKSLSLQFERPLDERIFSPALAQEIVEELAELIPFYRHFAALCAKTE